MSAAPSGTVTRSGATRGFGLLAAPHHDGSDLYVLDQPEEPGGEAVLRLRVPRGTEIDAVVLRYVRDGEPRSVAAERDAETETDTWWRASFPATSRSTRYRWALSGPDTGLAWLNGRGLAAHDVADADDFVLSLDRGGPGWHLGSVVYEIFPDRFASSGDGVDPPAWAVRRRWDERPTGRGRDTAKEWFGGDLRGVEQHLDHIERLGANVIYLTPVFPARSTHRYDATTFERVDPLLGGDAALESLARAAEARGIRLLGDLTTNHCGDGHEWFLAAQAAPEAPERELFYFDETNPNGYESWLDIPVLPKLDWRSPELRSRMAAVAQRWLEAGLAGWRIDVANMTGRFRDIDVNVEAARTIRAALDAVRPDGVLVAEHFHDYREDLVPGGWHGVMNYSGFLKPAWMWLVGDDPGAELRRRFHDLLVPLPRIGGGAAVEAMRAFRAGVAWPATLHSWPLLDSHDTARFRTVAGTRERHAVGVGLQMTTPGVPMVFAGDELGLEGEWGEDARRPMPWGRDAEWDTSTLEEYRRLIALRRSSGALARGGIRYVHVDDETIAYLRETSDERLLCLAVRAGSESLRIPLASLGAAALEPLHGSGASISNGEAALPAGGPSFHVWRLSNG